MQMYHGVYSGRRVLITGHTGFKGGWLGLWLRELGAEVYGYGLPAPTRPSLHELIALHTFRKEFTGDITDIDALRRCLVQIQPDYVFHLAAQPLVRASYKNPLETLRTNVLGTAYVLDILRQMNLRTTLVVVTTDKCYENQSWEHAYRETDPLGGHDIYSASKAAAELVTQSWRRSFFTPNPRLGAVASARAGNVIGGGDYAEDRIVPDAIRSLQRGQMLEVRLPGATRPWQHVLDCLSGYLWLGACASREPDQVLYQDAFNFGPGPEAHRSVAALLAELHKHLPGAWYSSRHLQSQENPGKEQKAGANPKSTGFNAGSVRSQPHEARHLNLAIDRAVARLGWRPTWRFEQAVLETARWYKARHLDRSINLLGLSIGQIEAYQAEAARLGLPWTGADRSTSDADDGSVPEAVRDADAEESIQDISDHSNPNPDSPRLHAPDENSGSGSSPKK